jgi:multiple sugar transport system permease protein
MLLIPAPPASTSWSGAMPKKGLRGQRRVAAAMAAPGLAILVLLAIGPLIFMVLNSFRAWELVSPAPPQFVGFGNYVRVFKDPRFWNALRNTLLLLLLGLAIQIPLGLLIALLFNRDFPLKRVATGFFMIPVMITPVVSGFNWRLIYHEQFGPLNFLIRTLHLGGGRAWIAEPEIAIYAILALDTWQWTPFVAMVLLAGLQSIPRQVYEATNVDGATGWQAFWRVTLPMLMPTFVLVVLLRTIFILRIFDPVMILTGGGPGSATETLSVYTYLTGFRYFSMGYTSALAVIQLVILTIIANLFLSLTGRGGRRQ